MSGVPSGAESSGMGRQWLLWAQLQVAICLPMVGLLGIYLGLGGDKGISLFLFILLIARAATMATTQLYVFIARRLKSDTLVSGILWCDTLVWSLPIVAGLLGWARDAHALPVFALALAISVTILLGVLVFGLAAIRMAVRAPKVAVKASKYGAASVRSLALFPAMQQKGYDWITREQCSTLWTDCGEKAFNLPPWSEAGVLPGIAEGDLKALAKLARMRRGRS